jgi:hypothetical protein
MVVRNNKRIHTHIWYVFFCFVFCLVLFCSVFESGSQHIAQTGLELMFIQPQAPEFWNYRCAHYTQLEIYIFKSCLEETNSFDSLDTSEQDNLCFGLLKWGIDYFRPLDSRLFLSLLDYCLMQTNSSFISK